MHSIPPSQTPTNTVANQKKNAPLLYNGNPIAHAQLQTNRFAADSMQFAAPVAGATAPGAGATAPGAGATAPGAEATSPGAGATAPNPLKGSQTPS